MSVTAARGAIVITTEMVRQYEEDGFAIIPNVIDADLVGEASEHVAWLQRRYPELRPEEFHHPLIRNDAFWVRLVSDPRLVDVAEAIIGPNIALFTAHYVCKPPHDGQPVLWHQDGAYWNLDPMEAVTVWLAVDESTPENGCLQVIPGSHREPLRKPDLRTDIQNMLASEIGSEYIERWEAERGVRDIVLKPGDVSIHHPAILHRSQANLSGKRRCGLDMGFMPTSTRISNEGLYLNALLIRGEAVPGVNEYRPFPEYSPEESIPFRGWQEWGDRIAVLNSRPGVRDDFVYDNTPLEATMTMIGRLREGTVKR
jgi:phytanoyl-CoA hydroxylase